ncbi:hypothetical protein [Sphingomonas sp. SUN039]|uniref:hypothetical protein n=1 Tax=Sphingomonas sp. SUN039 TaxID=2937787 RepID=UPI00216495CF|nr:hypothetical protein [Sphingomonas sp. SUN039]UVO55553.1 hypothetical protein M0209_16035 [Sphingomonas sp. SUN039]
MKTVKFLVLGGLIAATSVAAQAADRRLTVVNATAHTMTRLYASPTTGTPVDEDMLGDTILKPGQSAQLVVGGGDACDFNLKASFDDDKTRARKVNVCEVRTYRFTGE